ncbi:MAG TPA: pitrilysin family protein [Pyrinomonadaceae bacterium]|jgi:zinc protease|nr:pitrilysin family protein [Pyrinomonadaceae bacterium]
MHRHSRKILAPCAALVLCALALTGARAQTRMPRVEFKERRLANGIRVLSAADRSSPTVAIQVWYKVGSKDDPDGRSGFAHLFEHIMFKSTKNMKSEMMDRLTEDVGGMNNAFTADDVTVYYEVVPSNYLETLLWAEADRMGSLNVDDSSFKSERDVVKEEFRSRVLAPPYGRLLYLMEQKSFVKHPYKRPGIGSIEELEASSLADVQGFHSTFYRPDNATLVVVGDFDQPQLDAWVDKYFARVPKPDKPLPRVSVKEPARTGELRSVEFGQNVPLPAVAFTFLTPPKSDADTDALRVAEVILSGGESSRLYRTLVYEQQIAQQVSAGNDLREDASLFTYIAILASEKKPEDAERGLLAEIKKMQDAPVSPAELEKAKNQLVTGQLQERETNNGKALAIGDAAVLLGDPQRVNTDLARLERVTAADVQRVMKKYMTDANRLVIYYLPESMKKPAPAPGGAGAKTGGDAPANATKGGK